MQFLLVGNYGVGNVGDEALKEYFLTHFPEVKWNVLSAHPTAGEYPRFPAGVRSFVSFRWLRTLRALRQSDGLVLGGGTLFTDTESVRACFIWWVHVMAACAFRKPVYVAFQGFGPFHTQIGEWLARSAVGKAQFVSVRDARSHARAESWHLNKKIVQSFDPVYSFIRAKNVKTSTQNVLVIIPRKNSGDRFRQHARELAAFRQWDDIRIVTMQPENESEKRICREIVSSCDAELGSSSGVEACSANVAIHPVHSIDELIASISDADYVLSHRYHGTLAALALGKECEVVAQVEHDKMSELELMMKDEERCAVLVESGEQALAHCWRGAAS